ncbi:hypothetical protein [Streptomyces sp. NPDC004284]|uniref:hypothetical protein n=1 Tax=Streptomyces sp. NPDC004284 TaxID=3364695 RepID=UPI0036899E9F
MADVVYVANADENARTTVVLHLDGLVAVLWLVERHPALAQPPIVHSVLALWSLLLAGPQTLFGPGEIAILLSFIAVRHGRGLNRSMGI